ncbi:MAG TPA: alpha/beta fold hydrolase [Steroidobacteraceae bacterium]|nr:alpha/beta fold hydrolase [Steroidobacteraceae bacterium]
MSQQSHDRMSDGQVRVRRAYFDCRFGQLNVRTAFPASGGFDERTTLLCVHAEWASSRLFARWLPAIAHDRSVYAPDLPGCGESDPPARQPSIAEYAGALVDFANTMHFRQLDVLACGAGALIAAELALAAPQTVRRLIFIPMSPASADAQSASQGRAWPAEGEAELLHNGPAARWLTAAAREYKPGERLALLKQPTLLLCASDESGEGARARQFLRAARSADLEQRSMELFGLAGQALAQRVRDFLDAR